MGGSHAAGVLATDPPKPLGQVAKAVVGLLCLVIVADLVALWADLQQLGLVTDIRDGERVPYADLVASDDRVGTAGTLQGAAYLAAVVAFLVWYARAYRNLERLGARGGRWGRTAAIFFWFIPIGNLFLPKKVMNDVWRGSDPDLPAVVHAWTDRKVSPLLHWWWAAWIVSSVVINILLRDSLDPTATPDEAVSLATRFVAYDVVDIVPAVLAILVVRKVTARQEERRERHARGDLAPGPGAAPGPPEPVPAPA